MATDFVINSAKLLLFDLLYDTNTKICETFEKRYLLPPANGGTVGSNFNTLNTQCIPACPVVPADRTGWLIRQSSVADRLSWA